MIYYKLIKRYLCLYKNHTLVLNSLGDIVILNPSGDRFFIGLDDSKTNGPKRFIPMSFDEQLQCSFDYIDWITKTKKNKD